MPKLITEKEVKKAAALASRKKGTTRQELADKLGVTKNRAKTVFAHAMKNGAWSTDRKGGSGKDGRTLIYRLAKK